MGTVYSAQVEVFSGEGWEALSLWDLGKDYSFAIAWSEVASDGWPDDFRPMDYEDHEEQQHFGEGELLLSLTIKETSIWFEELKNHVQNLINRGLEIRVVTWGD